MMGTYYLGPLVMLPFAVVLSHPFVLLAGTLGAEKGSAPMTAVVVLATALFYFGLMYVSYVWPRHNKLDLHQRGFRYRLSWRRAAIPFGELRSLVIGIRPGVGEQLVFATARMSGTGALSRATTLEWHYSNGRKRRIRSCLLLFEAQDLVAFFDLIDRGHPGLLHTGSGP